MSITLTLNDRLTPYLRRASEKTMKRVSEAVERSGFQLANDARRLAPKDTSTLARSHTFRMVGPRRGRVFTNVDYARVQNDGFRGIQYVRPHHRRQTHAFGKKLTPPQRVQVRRYARRVDYRGTGYFDRAVDRQRPRFRRRVVRALRTGLKG